MVNTTLEKLKNNKDLLMQIEDLVSKWMVFVKIDIYPKFFKRVIEVLGDDGYEAELA